MTFKYFFKIRILKNLVKARITHPSQLMKRNPYQKYHINVLNAMNPIIFVFSRIAKQAAVTTVLAIILSVELRILTGASNFFT
jgi:hypothetical protein